MNGQIGRPYKVIYEAKNYVSGLIGITAKVLKPNGTVHANYVLQEITELGFEGTYFFNLLTNSVDPIGEYSIIIESPNENNYKKVTKVEMRSIAESGGGVVGDFSDVDVDLFVEKESADLDIDSIGADLELKDSGADLDANFPIASLDSNIGLASFSYNMIFADLDLCICKE